jgi:hypothetical protein
MKSAVLEMTVKMLDITHHPRHFEASLEIAQVQLAFESISCTFFLDFMRLHRL